MPPPALFLLFISALLHTGWNLLLKGAPEKYIASWGTTVVGALLALPLLFYLGLPPPSVWGLLIASAAVEGIYFASLSYAYRDNDFSLIYPIARGTAPGLLFIWAILLLGEQFSPAGLLGLALIVAGLIVVGLGGVLRDPGHSPHWPGVAVALLTALCISIYTVIDGAAVKRTDPTTYVLALFILIPALVTPLVVHHYGWSRLGSEFRVEWRRFLVMSVLGILAYALALQAYHVAPVGYAGAIREMSVVMGAFAGWQLLGEDFGPLRLAGSAVVFVGILIITLRG